MEVAMAKDPGNALHNIYIVNAYLSFVWSRCYRKIVWNAIENGEQFV